jgi:hypothetical protein
VGNPTPNANTIPEKPDNDQQLWVSAFKKVVIKDRAANGKDSTAASQHAPNDDQRVWATAFNKVLDAPPPC